MTISDTELDALVRITGAYETGGKGYAMVAGNFDGQGISCGVLQWNIGQGSLQPMVQAVGRAQVLASMPTLGVDMWRAATSGIGTGLAIVKGWQTGSALGVTARRELVALMTSDAMKAQQDGGVRATAGRAEKEADAWAAARGGGSRTLREMAFFFDIATQNGSSSGLDHADVAAFRTRVTPGKADDIICDWYLAQKKSVAGQGDGVKNAALWRDRADAAALDLLILGYLRANKAKSAWRVDVMNRKGTIAMRTGWVHKGLMDFTAFL